LFLSIIHHSFSFFFYKKIITVDTLRTHFVTATAGAATKTALPYVAMTISPPAAAAVNDDEDSNTDSVADTQQYSNSRATRKIRRWTPEENAELNSAVANTWKTKWGKECKRDWFAILALVPGPMKEQCSNRWHNGLDSSVWT
jgi:hypothetical protein